MIFFRWILGGVIIAFLLPWLFATCNSDITPDERGYIVKVGDKVENFAVTLTDGTEQQLSDFKAQVVILNFFASWCSVCRKEIPFIEKEVWQEFKDKNVVVVGVDFKEKLETVNKFLNDMNITYPVALDTAGTVFARFAQGGVTRNVVLDKDLKIIFLTRLFSEQEFNAMIERIKAEINQANVKSQ